MQKKKSIRNKKNFRSQNENGKAHKIETSEIAFLVLRVHFNLFSVPYVLN